MIGLHPRDNSLRPLSALRHLRRTSGNTFVLVEHDREVIEASDHLLDFGPGSGEGGGRITASGTPAKVKVIGLNRLTGSYPERQDRDPGTYRPPTGRRGFGLPMAIMVKGGEAQPRGTSTFDSRLGVDHGHDGCLGGLWARARLVEDILWKAAARVPHRLPTDARRRPRGDRGAGSYQ